MRHINLIGSTGHCFDENGSSAQNLNNVQFEFQVDGEGTMKSRNKKYAIASESMQSAWISFHFKHNKCTENNLNPSTVVCHFNEH